jgi:hypothetical protein
MGGGLEKGTHHVHIRVLDADDRDRKALELTATELVDGPVCKATQRIRYQIRCWGVKYGVLREGSAPMTGSRSSWSSIASKLSMSCFASRTACGVREA